MCRPTLPRAALNARILDMIVDLSHRISNGLRGYPGIPPLAITEWLTHEQSRARYQGQCELLFSQVSVVAGVGTYLDSPYHRQPGLPDHATLPLDGLVDLPGVIIDLRHRPGRPITSSLLSGGAGGAWRGKAVILQTGMDAHWETDRYWDEGPFLEAAAADALVASGLAVLGVDFLNVDDMTDPRRPVHTTLLRAGIPIVENLKDVSKLPASGFRFHAPPVPFAGVASFAIRAYAVLG